MIGIDAAEITYIRENLHHLPNLRRVLASGVTFDICSDARFLPGSIWPSFFTEKSPGQHGFYLIMGWDGARMRLRRAAPDWLPLEPFWRDLARHGLKVITVDVPMSFGPRTGSSLEIVGWGAHQDLSDFSVYPPALMDEVRRQFGVSSLGAEIPVENQVGTSAHSARDRLRQRLVTSAHRKAELINWLAATREWDFLLAVFGEAHRAGHVLWPSEAHQDPEMLLDVYRAVDASLASVIACATARNAQVVLFALHGMGSNNSQRHFAPEIVRRFNRFWNGAADGNGGASVPAPRTLLRELRARLPRRFTARLANSLPLALKDSLTNCLYAGGTDWSKTPAIAVKSDGNGYIRLNLLGREERGILSRGDQERGYVRGLQNCFESFKSQFGAPLVDQLRYINDITEGQMIDSLPDLVVTWASQPHLVHKIYSPAFGEITAHPDEWRGGYHRERGFITLLDSSATYHRYPAQIHVTRLASLTRDLLFH